MAAIWLDRYRTDEKLETFVGRLATFGLIAVSLLLRSRKFGSTSDLGPQRLSESHLRPAGVGGSAEQIGGSDSF
jgi:hypothetical protein